MVRNARSLLRAPRPGVKLAGLCLLSALAGLLLAEGLLAVFQPQIFQRPAVWEFDPQLGWRHKADAAGRLRSPEFDVEYRIDASRLRIDEKAGAGEPAAPGLRLALYGDSFAEGWGVSASASLAGRLQTTLRATDGSPVQVLNYGVAGYGTDQQLLLYESAGRRRPADIVILLFYGNDLWNNASRRGIGAERGDKPYFVLDPRGTLSLQGVPVRRDPGWDRLAGEGSVGARLRRSWHLAALLYAALAPAELPPGQQHAFYAGLYGRHAPEYARYWQLTCRLLGRFADRVTADGGRFLLVYAPSIVQVDGADWQRKRQRFGLEGDYDLEKPNRILRAWSRQEGVPFLDLLPLFTASQAAGNRLFFQDSHWNEAGHRLAAVEVERFLTEGAWMETDR